jgi:OHCU decarboxylase
LDREAFVARFGSVWEHSPWIAEATWNAIEPEGGWTAYSLHAVMCSAMRAGKPEAIMRLIQAHPDLAGRLALAKKLTPESTTEQASAGLDQLTTEEQRTFLDLNDRYKAKFAFPFIVAVTGLSKHDILKQFQQRLENDHDSEWNEALRQIEKIALLRLDCLFDEAQL